MNDTLQMLETSVQRILASAWQNDAHSAAGVWPVELWRALGELEIGRLLIPEERGGAGLSFSEGLSFLRFVGTCAPALPLPVAETIAAGWLLNAAGIEMPSGPLTIGAGSDAHAPVLRKHGGSWILSGTIPRVPWAGHVSFIVVAGKDSGGEEALAVVSLEDARIEKGLNLAGEPRDTVHFDGARVEATARCSGAIDRVLRAGASIRTAQIAAACQAALEMTVDYARTRQQFGRAIGRFQAVQQNLAVMAGQAAAAAGAAELAGDAMDGRGSSLGVAFGKARAGAAAGVVAALAHQTFAAIGFAEEHTLHTITKRLLSWRDEMGPENYWARRIGELAFDEGGPRLWPLMSGT